MKIKYKIQKFQTEAVESVVDCFKGQPNIQDTYRPDPGVVKENTSGDTYRQMVLDDEDDSGDLLGYRNTPLKISEKQILDNLHQVQHRNNISESKELSKSIGCCAFDVEMETGTGKTYIYIKTIFELNKRYGWSKFIVVVPSVAIREGVKKSFEAMAEHFKQLYGQGNGQESGKEANFFVYDSDNLSELDSFSKSAGIYVMIINTQAFNTSFDENAKNKTARKIYTVQDNFNSRRPIDAISSNRPILILDEPQKMEGKKTLEALRQFNPLFALYYSATHKTKHNTVYVLDPIDAYNERLVKKIEVKGVECKNSTGTNGYCYLQEIVVDKDKPPRARLEIEVNGKGGSSRKTFLFEQGDQLVHRANLKAYDGMAISDIDALNNTVSFTGGLTLAVGECSGAIEEKQIRRLQIQETIRSHFEKERELFKQGIKVLSLFFIDKVEHYRKFENGSDSAGDYGKMFEEEYQKLHDEEINRKDLLSDESDQRYIDYLRNNISVEKTHAGYFSVDKKTGNLVNPKIVGRKETESQEISDYELILKDKERLLSQDEPVRFIFSHSALREGWDNPNIFQICVLKEGGESTVGKRQEVGRGLRLCVNQQGERIDAEYFEGDADQVHEINLLTVVTSQGYQDFVSSYQSELEEELHDRPRTVSVNYFTGKSVPCGPDGRERTTLTDEQGELIKYYLTINRYVDIKGNVTDKYRQAVENNTLEPLPEEIAPRPVDLEPMSKGIHKLIQAVYDSKLYKEMIDDARKKVSQNPLTENFKKEEFQELWNCINQRYVYEVTFDSDELIKNAIHAIDNDTALMGIESLNVTITTGSQTDRLKEENVRKKETFQTPSNSKKTENVETIVGDVRYDLVGEIAERAILTRRSVIKILRGIKEEVFGKYKKNPEVFISKVSQLIVEQKATQFVEKIVYKKSGEPSYDSKIFTEDKHYVSRERALQANKNVQEWVFCDSDIEMNFARELENHQEITVYARLPRGFKIPTPVGNYAPDWALAFQDSNGERHLFFVAETKGTLSTMELRPVEQDKIEYAKVLFEQLSKDCGQTIHYHKVTNYDDLMSEMNKIRQNS